MGITTNISWCDVTWNVARGCTKVNSDCARCYMYRDSERFKYDAKSVIRTKTVFNLPLRIKEPSKIFTSSLTDFFHEEIDSYRNEAWDIIRKCPQHTFQILTKRPERIKDHLPPDWGDGWDNVWLGASVGSQESIHMVRDMIKVPSKVKFLSIEPLHAEVDLNEYYFSDRVIKHVPYNDRTKLIDLVDWCIIGGESGNNTGKYRYRECKLEWIEKLVGQCKAADVPVFVKQLGTHLAKEMGLRDRHGGDWTEWTEHLRIREFPKQK